MNLFVLLKVIQMRHILQMAKDKFTPSFVTEPRFERRVPEGDTLYRDVCLQCGHVAYNNPKIVVGAVVSHHGRILLCRRAIEPRKAYWTLPAGYLEEHETPEQGAIREAKEEACADISLDLLLAVYSIPRISQVQLMYRARLANEIFAPGIESLEVRLFDWDDIPWTDLAFPSVTWALEHYRQSKDQCAFAPFTNPLDPDKQIDPGNSV